MDDFQAENLIDLIFMVAKKISKAYLIFLPILLSFISGSVGIGISNKMNLNEVLSEFQFNMILAFAAITFVVALIFFIKLLFDLVNKLELS